MQKLLIVVAIAAALGAAALAHGAPSTTGSGTLSFGKTLYRKYCGQCHALNAALAAGFGTETGLGTDGGPNFNNLRVSYRLTVLALTLPFVGHEVLARKLTWAQIVTVSRYVAATTTDHQIAAQGTDG